MKLTCRQCRKHLDAYIHGELPPRARRLMDQHLNCCPSCAALYVRQRDLSRDLAQTLPQLAQTSAPQFSRIWAGIQADIARPRINAHPQARFGVAALMLVLALLLPWSLEKQRSALALPLPPIPVSAALTGTPANMDALDVVDMDAIGSATPTARAIAALITPEIRNTP